MFDLSKDNKHFWPIIGNGCQLGRFREILHTSDQKKNVVISLSYWITKTFISHYIHIFLSFMPTASGFYFTHSQSIPTCHFNTLLISPWSAATCPVSMDSCSLFLNLSLLHHKSNPPMFHPNGFQLLKALSHLKTATGCHLGHVNGRSLGAIYGEG